MRTAIACVLLLAAAAGAGLALAREPEDASKVQAQSLLAEALAGEPGKEVVAQSYTFAPGAVLPWHIHPDAHEIAYVIEGDFTFQIEGEAPKEIKAGEAIANVVLDAGGQRLVASVTVEAVNDLGLSEGSEVTALIKASDVLLATGD